MGSFTEIVMKAKPPFKLSYCLVWYALVSLYVIFDRMFVQQVNTLLITKAWGVCLKR